MTVPIVEVALRLNNKHVLAGQGKDLGVLAAGKKDIFKYQPCAFGPEEL